MKSLWIVNRACGKLAQLSKNTSSSSGTWLDAILEQARETDDEIVVVNITSIAQELVDENIHYYSLVGKSNEEYKYKSKNSIDEWKRIIDYEKPNIIIAWGTEYPFSLAAMKSSPNIPILVYTQGILKSIEEHYIDGLSNNDIKKAITLRDIIRHDDIINTKKRYKKNSEYEKEILIKANNAIVENKWAENQIKSINPNCNIYYSNLIISKVFDSYMWDINRIEKNTIMCPASDYPIKGLHILLKALHIVKKKYPNVKLYIPGNKLRSNKSMYMKLRVNGYEKLINEMIDTYELSENVIYMGTLSSKEMACKMEKVNCFVMSSSIENHSSTLKEAMTVGTPCISSKVGGIPEYAFDEDNCLLYDFHDYNALANNICRLFEDNELCLKLSRNSINSIKNKRSNNSSYIQLRDIMSKIINK